MEKERENETERERYRMKTGRQRRRLRGERTENAASAGPNTATAQYAKRQNAARHRGEARHQLV